MEAAEKVASIPLPSVAAREAYTACLHAANAYVFERTGDVPRTHKGLHLRFRELCLRLGEIDIIHADFLQQAYRLKENNDYGDRSAVTPESLPGIIASARALIAAVEAALAPAP